MNSPFVAHTGILPPGSSRATANSPGETDSLSDFLVTFGCASPFPDAATSRALHRVGLSFAKTPVPVKKFIWPDGD